MLATNPEVQQWLCDDLDRVLANESSDLLDWDYDQLFNKLVAPLCVMVRLCGAPPAPKLNPFAV